MRVRHVAPFDRVDGIVMRRRVPRQSAHVPPRAGRLLSHHAASRGPSAPYYSNGPLRRLPGCLPMLPRRSTAVVNDIAATTNGNVDLLIATHEHWDHFSGFVQARDHSQRSLPPSVAPRTEDPNHAQAQKSPRSAGPRRARCSERGAACAWPARTTSPTTSARFSPPSSVS